jgi:hypothetical protein
MAGPRPRIDSIPVTRTSVIVATATASWMTPDRVTRQRLSRIVLRLICFALATADAFNHRDSSHRITPPRPAVTMFEA